MKNNKIIGNEFEKEFAQYLQEKGMFVYNVPNKYTGQPFDIIAVKNNVFYGFECKHCKGNYFTLDRIEDNQVQAFKKLQKSNTSNYYFVFKSEVFNTVKFCGADYIMDCLRYMRKNIDLSIFKSIEELEMIL